jgi:hypothetical protein
MNNKSKKLISWDELKKTAISKCSGYSHEYLNRLKFEIIEIEKQGASDYWIDIAISDRKFNDNKNGLVLPFLLDVTDVDPIKKRTFVLDNSGVECDITILTLDDGKKITIPSKCTIQTPNGPKSVISLQVGDELV